MKACMKRWLPRCAALLCSAALLIGGVFSNISPVRAEEAGGNYIIKELPMKLSTSGTLLAGEEFGSAAATFDAPIDLTQYGYLEDSSKLAIQMDVYVGGDDDFTYAFTDGDLWGELEITSSGQVDHSERWQRPSCIDFVKNEWARVTVPFSAFQYETLAGNSHSFDPANFNCLRLYIQGPPDGSADNSQGTAKVCNVCIVDLRVPESERPTVEERPLGDGTFVPDPPVWQTMPVTEGYGDGVQVIGGYNLQDYVETHRGLPLIDKEGNTDYSLVIQSLLNGLAAAGGGALFIPRGIYPCRSEISVPIGVSIIGEWKNPEIDPQVTGTVLAVYHGEESGSAAFLTLSYHTQVKNMAFWYPEQTAAVSKVYSPTVRAGALTDLTNITFVNPYQAINTLGGGNSPNARNIYGTPLYLGMEMDYIVDLSRYEEIHFAPQYWMESGLEGAPVSDEDVQMLESTLYDTAVGMIVRRMDWSLYSFIDIRGYNVGMQLDNSVATPGDYPNGQFSYLYFENCQTAVYACGVADMGVSIVGMTVKNCKNGVVFIDNSRYDGVLQLAQCDISADRAIYIENTSTFKMIDSTVRKGIVTSNDGNLILMNNTFYTAAPQVVLDFGTCSAALVGNKTASGADFVYDNAASCPCSFDPLPMENAEYTVVTPEEACGEVNAPESDCVWIADLTNDASVDVTEELQALLTEAATTGGTVFVPPGRYRINGSLFVPSGVELRGAADYSTLPKPVNTVFMVYTAVEEGKTDMTSTATITLGAEAGIRGIIFNYPYQQVNERLVDAEKDWYDFDYIPYPFAIRGAGADVWVENVSIRNGWNGVDMQTYRCDNFEVNRLFGHYFHRGVVAGGGSTGGVIRNMHCNYNPMQQGNVSLWSGWGDTDEIRILRFHQPMQAQFQNHAIIMQLGDVTDQLVYNCMTYGGGIGLNLVEESGNAPDVRVHGYAIDYGNVAVKIEAVEHAEFINLELTSFNQCGSDEGRYAVDPDVNPMYDVWATDTFDGDVCIYNLSIFGPAPNAGIRVDGGVLRAYNVNLAHTETPLLEMGENGTLKLFALNVRRADNPLLTAKHAENVYINGADYYSDFSGTEEIGEWKNHHRLITNWSTQKEMNLAPDAEVIYAENFEKYTPTDSAGMLRVNDINQARVRFGVLRTTQSAVDPVMFLRTVNEGVNAPFSLQGGNEKDAYCIEWRISIRSLRASADNEIVLNLANGRQAGKMLCTFTDDGTVTDADGKVFARYDTAEWYRVVCDIDARNAENKTYTVRLLDDNGKLLGSSGKHKMNDIFQGENTVGGFQIMSLAAILDAAETSTEVQLDYFVVIRNTQQTARGDVDGDGDVDSTDARLTLQYVVKKIDAAALDVTAADADGDGDVDSTDARLILQYAVGKITDFPANA